tara:strand:- start:986 stop:1675 length:690 start_codon:yes stop_codon:yes gene_type:complete
MRVIKFLLSRNFSAPWLKGFCFFWTDMMFPINTRNFIAGVSGTITALPLELLQQKIEMKNTTTWQTKKDIVQDLFSQLFCAFAAVSTIDFVESLEILSVIGRGALAAALITPCVSLLWRNRILLRTTLPARRAIDLPFIIAISVREMIIFTVLFALTTYHNNLGILSLILMASTQILVYPIKLYAMSRIVSTKPIQTIALILESTKASLGTLAAYATKSFLNSYDVITQ